MRRIFSFLSVLLFGLLLTSCGAPSLVLYPDDDQARNTQRMTRGGYDFLQSSRENVRVTLSLRSATPTYVQAYVSISNQSSTPLTVDPTDIEVVAMDDGGETFSAYEPTEVPGVVQKSARENYLRATALNSRMNASGPIRGKAEYGTGSGTYSSDSDSNRSYLDVMLQRQELAAANAVGGLVYTPFSSSVRALRIEVPVAGQTHTFRYTVRLERNA